LISTLENGTQLNGIQKEEYQGKVWRIRDFLPELATCMTLPAVFWQSYP